MSASSRLQPVAPPQALPRSYTLSGVLAQLRFKSRQHFFKSGFYAQIRRYRLTDHLYVYHADDVDEWARRLARRRILIAHAVVSRSRKYNTLINAPATSAQDQLCPICQGFALLNEGRVLCEAGHSSPHRANQAKVSEAPKTSKTRKTRAEPA